MNAAPLSVLFFISLTHPATFRSLSDRRVNYELVINQSVDMPVKCIMKMGIMIAYASIGT